MRYTSEKLGIHTKMLHYGVTFEVPNSWIENFDFGMNGRHLNQSAAKRLSTCILEFVALEVDDLIRTSDSC
jgi:hypothetical protein